MYHCPGCGVMQLAGIPHINCDLCDGVGFVANVKKAQLERAERYEKGMK